MKKFIVPVKIEVNARDEEEAMLKTSHILKRVFIPRDYHVDTPIEKKEINLKKKSLRED